MVFLYEYFTANFSVCGNESRPVCLRPALLPACKTCSRVFQLLQQYETGVLHGVGLRDTLEPDPDNTGVGSFRSQAAYFLESQREFSCFMVGDKGHNVRCRTLSHRFKGP